MARINPTKSDGGSRGYYETGPGRAQMRKAVAKTAKRVTKLNKATAAASSSAASRSAKAMTAKTRGMK